MKVSAKLIERFTNVDKEGFMKVMEESYMLAENAKAGGTAEEFAPEKEEED